MKYYIRFNFFSFWRVIASSLLTGALWTKKNEKAFQTTYKHHHNQLSVEYASHWNYSRTFNRTAPAGFHGFVRMAPRILHTSLEGQLAWKGRRSQDLVLKPSSTEVRGSFVFIRDKNIFIGRTCQIMISRVRERWSKTDLWKLISSAKGRSSFLDQTLFLAIMKDLWTR